jgi:hypothetical protein
VHESAVGPKADIRGGEFFTLRSAKTLTSPAG